MTTTKPRSLPRPSRKVRKVPSVRASGTVMSDLREAMRSVTDHYSGKKTLRTHHIPVGKPVSMSAERIRRIRTSLQLSQELFARCLHTSRRTLEKWEQGTSHPTGAAVALMALLDHRHDLIEALIEVA